MFCALAATAGGSEAERMTSANRRPRHPLASVDSVVALLANYALAFVGAVVAMAGFVALVTAKSVKAFVKDHPYPLYIALVIAVLTISATLNYVRFLRRENARLTCLASRESPTSNDVRYFAGLMVDLPIDGAVMTWLKRTRIDELRVTDIPADVLTTLDRTVQRSRLRPVGFDDPQINASFAAFTLAIAAFADAVEQWTFLHQSSHWRGDSDVSASPLIPPWGEHSSTRALCECQAGLIAAYDALIVTAHGRGIDIASVS